MTTNGAGNTLAPLPASILTQGPNLIVSIHTALDDEQLVRLQRDLLDRVGSQRCRGILIDVAALDVLDSSPRARWATWPTWRGCAVPEPSWSGSRLMWRWRS